MKTQNYSNHRRWVIGYHAITFPAILALIIAAIRNLVVNPDDNMYPPVLFVLIAFILFFIFFFARGFSLMAQDRAIKAEQQFRYYVLTSKTLPEELKMRQIIGLRFASDEEFPGLVDRALKEGLSEKQIKKEIKNWKPDTYRV